jgi:hypothetical protein
MPSMQAAMKITGADYGAGQGALEIRPPPFCLPSAVAELPCTRRRTSGTNGVASSPSRRAPSPLRLAFSAALGSLTCAIPALDSLTCALPALGSLACALPAAAAAAADDVALLFPVEHTDR